MTQQATKAWTRPSGRALTELRPLSVSLSPQKFAAGSVIIKWGDTHVLCSASLEEGVPSFTDQLGWVSAEYSLLPGSTHTRARRERKSVGGRTAEIQRLIARSLRGALDLNQLQEHTLTLDCDVIQADGGTRCAAITGSYIAASIALHRLGYRPPHFAAVSFGLMEGHVITDLCYEEDSQVDVDCNVVWCESGLIEVQGTAERGTFSPSQLSEMLTRAEALSEQLFSFQREALRQAGLEG